MKNLGFKEHRVLNLKKTKLDSIKIELNSAFIECIKILMHTYHGVDLSHLRLDYMKLEDLFVQVKYSEEVGEFICGELCHLQTKEKNEERFGLLVDYYSRFYKEQINKELHYIAACLFTNHYYGHLESSDCWDMIELAHRCRTYAIRKKAHYKGFEKFKYYTYGKPDSLTDNGLRKLKFSFEDVLDSIFYALLFADDDSFEISLYDPVLDVEYYTTLGEVDAGLKGYVKDKLNPIRTRFNHKPKLLEKYKDTKIYLAPEIIKDSGKHYLSPCKTGIYSVQTSISKENNKLIVKHEPFMCGCCEERYEIRFDYGFNRWYLYDKKGIKW